QLRRGLPRDFSTRGCLPTARTLAVELFRFPNPVGRELDPLALFELAHAAERAPAAQIVQKRIQRRRRPAQRQPFARYIPFQIQSPLRQPASETQRSRRNDDLGRPAVCCSRRASIPDSIPIERSALRIGNQPVRACAGRVDLKKIAGPAISVRIENNADRVIRFRLPVLSHGFVPPHGVDRDAARLGILALEAEVDAVARYNHANLSFIRRRLSRLRRLLYQLQYVRLPPRRFVQASVEHDGYIGSNQSLRLRHILCRSATRAHRQEQKRSEMDAVLTERFEASSA